jgi:2,3-diketo-5-methylthio-1-phosphopentane phosphatase
MQQQVRLLDLNLEALHQHLNNIAIDPHFGGFLAQAAQLGYPVGVVSDGIDYAIHHILSRNQISGLSVAANQLEPTHHPDRWQLSSPHEAVGCASGTCKCACIAQARSAVADRVLLVGDGRSDFCAAHRADHVFAKGRLRDYCAAEGLPHTPIHDFEEAARLLPELQRRSA